MPTPPAAWENATPVFGIRYPKPTAPAKYLADMFQHTGVDVEASLLADGAVPPGLNYKTGTKAQRLAAPPVQDQVWVETDTGEKYIGTGSAWIPLTGGAKFLGVANFVTPVGSIQATEVPVCSLVVTVPVAGKIRMTFTALTMSTVAADIALVRIRENEIGGPIIADAVRPANSANVAQSTYMTTNSIVLDVTAGQHYYLMLIARLSGSGVISTAPVTQAPNSIAVDFLG